MVDSSNALMKDFLEFEGLTDQAVESRSVDDNDDEEMDPSFRPGNAAQLSSADIYYEVCAPYLPVPRKNIYLY
jgi:hypothetical protein